jgi:hypothetical protein
LHSRRITQQRIIEHLGQCNSAQRNIRKKRQGKLHGVNLGGTFHTLSACPCIIAACSAWCKYR